jgi:hypothetical protein
MPKQPQREDTEEDPELEVDPEAPANLFDEDTDPEGDNHDDEPVEREDIDLEDLSAMEGPDA